MGIWDSPKKKLHHLVCQCDLCGVVCFVLFCFVLLLFCIYVFLFFSFFFFHLFSFVICYYYGTQNKPHEGFFRLMLAFYLSLIVSVIFM